MEKWTPKWSAGNDPPGRRFLPDKKEAVMSGTRRKWDGDKPAVPPTDEDKDRDQKKPEKGVPDFDRSATDPDVIKHDGP